MRSPVLLLGVFALIYAEQQGRSPKIIPIPGGLQGESQTTRYWDCCVPTCSNPANKSDVTHGVVYCDADGTTRINDYSKQSECVKPGGGAYTCNQNQPWIVNETLAYGFTAAHIDGIEADDCCKCVLMAFQGVLKGKYYLAQITSAGPFHHHFMIQIPGGGVGANNGCSAQWKAPETGWGDRYGGVTSEEKCRELPSVLEEGCRFRWKFMEGVDMPNITYTQVQCPDELIAISGCKNSDDP